MTNFFEFTSDEKAYLRDQQAAAQAALSPFATRDCDGIRERTEHYQDPDIYLGRPCFVCDVEKIVHNPFYSRCADKTQVFSFFRNDDITRRSFHLQVVSRVGRTIGAALGLNLDLIEAIAVGHDLGHTPFGHEGERFLSEVYHERTGRYFNHNVHSVRLLRDVAQTNLCLQTYNGIVTHCGEKTFLEYRPKPCDTFAALDELLESCYVDQTNIRDLRPSTLEGCVVRISDIIAYIGKDRQDAARVGLVTNDDFKERTIIGTRNYEMIRNITRNLIKNSIGHDYIAMDAEVFEAINAVRDENYRVIYGHEEIRRRMRPVQQMMRDLYLRFIEDIEAGREESPVFRHHINHRLMRHDYTEELRICPDEAVVDYLASMTDDYFVDLYRYLFPSSPLNDEVDYRNYFLA